MAQFSGGMTSLELDDEDKYDAMPVDNVQPEFPYGTKICLTSAELEKLGIDVKEASVGDYFHINALACVTSISSTDGPNGPCDRLEAQIEAMKVLDIEDSDSGY